MRRVLACGAVVAIGLSVPAWAAGAAPTLPQILGYPFVSDLVAAPHGDRIAWVQDVRGVRNVWMAAGPDFTPRQVTRYTSDDGQELTGLAFSPDGRALVYVRGGDHDANWAADKQLAPDPADSPQEPKVAIWRANLDGGQPSLVAEGDLPTLSARDQIAYVKDDQVWTAGLDGKGARRLFFDRGRDRRLAWSPDGSRLAFVSDRADHAFIGVYSGGERPIVYLAPSTGQDGDPAWSPDGARIAYTRRPGAEGPPEPLLVQTPHPFSIWTADAATGDGRQAWRGPDTLDGSYPEAITGVNLGWAAGGRLVFTSDLDGWRHLYAVPADGGQARLLTPGRFMVEDVALDRGRDALVYAANTGDAPGDSDRRHLFRVPLAGGAPVPLTVGEAIETAPTPTATNRVAYVSWGSRRPAVVSLLDTDEGVAKTSDGRNGGALNDAAIRDFPSADLVVPQLVTFTAPDGTPVQGQLFAAANGAARKPGVIFVHGGPPRQMLLGWHYMDYYSNAYAVNQYLAAHGFVVLSVNYRLSIGYGRAFRQPPHAGAVGASEYQDVLAGARYLQSLPDVDPGRIGIWGGSYGGYLTALALARDSDIFKAGVDFHGVHDWSRELTEFAEPPNKRYEQGDWAQAMKVAFASSPDADVGSWRSPVLLIQGDDDRNVRFSQTVDLARRLDARGVRYAELVIPNEIHGFLRYASWLKADAATVAFLTRELGAASPPRAP